MSSQHVLRALASRSLLRAYHRLTQGKTWMFEGLLLYVPRGVFNPAHTLAARMLAQAMRPAGRVLDMGTGSGALALLAARSRDVGLAVGYDTSPTAVAAARINARLNGLAGKTVFTSSWNMVRELGPYDTILSNPPYLPLEPRDAADHLWCGGRSLRRAETMIRAAAGVAHSGTRLYLVFSTMASLEPIAEEVRRRGLLLKPCRYRRLPAETLVLMCGRAGSA